LTFEGAVAMSASFRLASFRDMCFGRVGGVVGSPGASARFTGVLEDIVWRAEAGRSPLLATMRAAADENNDRLSMSLLT
jgi:hypothetical protein